MLLRHIKIKNKLRVQTWMRHKKKEREKKIFNNSTLILTRCSFLIPLKLNSNKHSRFSISSRPRFLCFRMNKKIYGRKIYIFMFERKNRKQWSVQVNPKDHRWRVFFWNQQHFFVFVILLHDTTKREKDYTTSKNQSRVNKQTNTKKIPVFFSSSS